MTGSQLDRRGFLAAAAGGLAWMRRAGAQAPVTRPVVDETACPLETIVPMAADGQHQRAFRAKAATIEGPIGAFR